MYDSFSAGTVFYGRTLAVVAVAIALSVLAHLI